MKIIADLHIHSSYSRATSKDMDLCALDQWARLKGINLLGTGDFTHPAHFASIEKLLEPNGAGLFTLRGSKSGVHFMLTAEVSNIYGQGGKTRKIHNLIFAPSLKAARKINAVLGEMGNVVSDGRPIFGFSAEELIKVVLDASAGAMLVPAHVWTPWFSLFGSNSGFDSIEECFGDYAKHIHAVETGLSSDPAMNWRVPALDRVTLLSNSDAHSPAKLGREANVLNACLDYEEITGIIKTKDSKKFLYTIEFFPEEGKYHSDGHRGCGVLSSPEETIQAGGKCVVCGKGLTVGVMSRVNELAGRPQGVTPPGAIPAVRMIPLQEIIAEAFGVGVNSVKVKKEYARLVNEAGSEFHILLDMKEPDLIDAAGPRTAGAIIKVRKGDVEITPGFDGEFGKIKIFGGAEKIIPRGPQQLGLL